MPRYAITANFDEKETEKINKVCSGEHCSKYKLMRAAVLGYVEAYLDGEKENEPREREVEGRHKEHSQGRDEKRSETNSKPPFI